MTREEVESLKETVAVAWRLTDRIKFLNERINLLNATGKHRQPISISYGGCNVEVTRDVPELDEQIRAILLAWRKEELAKAEAELAALRKP